MSFGPSKQGGLDEMVCGVCREEHGGELLMTIFGSDESVSLIMVSSLALIGFVSNCV